jgi:hypothetical protein
LEARVNYYHTLTDRKIVDTGEGGGFFQINSLYAAGAVEEALGGFEGEVGVRLPLGDQVETRLFVGGYRLDSETMDDADGWRSRLELRPQTNVALEFAYQDDDILGSRGTFMVRYSFGYKKKSGIRTVRERMIQPPVRTLDMFTTDELSADLRESSAPGDRRLISADVYHIHNDPANDASLDWASLDGRYLGTGELGTYENPFNSVADCYASGQCQEGDYIYVHAGDGTTVGYQTGFVLEDGQHLIGQGVSLYGFGDDAYPNITANGMVVELADNTEVAGLAINNTSGAVMAGIHGLISTGTIHIHDNLIGLFVDNSTGTVSASGMNNWGMEIGSRLLFGETASQELIIERNEIQYSGSQGMLISSVTENGTQGDLRIRIFNNNVSNNGDMGMEFDNVARSGSTSNQSIVAMGNTIRNNGWNGFDVDNIAEGDGVAYQQITMTDCTIEENGHDGVELWQGAWPGGTAEQHFALQNSTVVDNDGVGVVVSNNARGGDARQTFELHANEISCNTESGLRLGNEAPPAWIDSVGGSRAEQSGELTGNSFKGNGGDGVYLHNNAVRQPPSGVDTAIQTVTLTDNAIDGNGDEGMEMDNQADWGNIATQTVTVNGGTFNGNASDGIDLEQDLDDGGAIDHDAVATQTLTVTGAQINGNGSHGMELNNAAVNNATAVQDVTVNDTEVRENTDAGVYVQSNEDNGSGSAVQIVDLLGSIITDNGINNILITNGGDQVVIFPDGTVITFP